MIREQDAPAAPTRPAADRPDERERLKRALDRCEQECQRLVNQLHSAEAATMRGLKRWQKARTKYKRAEKRRHQLIDQVRSMKGGRK